MIRIVYEEYRKIQEVKLRSGENDLETWCMQNGREDLLQEWDKGKNEEINLTPSSINWNNSRTEVSWVCPNGHPYEMTVSKRTNKNKGCPYCSATHQHLLVGFNDLETWCMQNGREDLLREWDYEENKKIGITPQNVGRNSKEWVHWICPKGHRYVSKINDRVNSRSGCTVCRELSTSSVPEKLLFYYINLALGDHYTIRANDRTQLWGRNELDIYIPELKIAIEYDGYEYHKSSDIYTKDIKKSEWCIDKDITLIRVREKGLENIDGCYCIFRRNNQQIKYMDECVSKTLCYIRDVVGVPIKQDLSKTGAKDDFINCERDRQAAQNLRDKI